MMIENIDTKNVYQVYGTAANKNGEPWFLIYDNNQWLWVDAVKYQPAKFWTSL